MSTLTQPSGPPPPGVYRRRRLVALVLALLVLALLVWGVSALVAALRGEDPVAVVRPASTQSAPAPTSAAPATSAPTPTATTSAPASAGKDCPAEVVEVVATADKPSYALGSTAKLGMTITNTGTVACELDAGSAALELVVVSGPDRIWSSDDCQKAGESRPTTMEPGAAGTLASSVEWALERSAKGCAEDLPALKAGTYQLTARAGKITSEPLVLQIQG